MIGVALELPHSGHRLLAMDLWMGISKVIPRRYERAVTPDRTAHCREGPSHTGPLAFAFRRRHQLARAVLARPPLRTYRRAGVRPAYGWEGDIVPTHPRLSFSCVRGRRLNLT
jgi:hypothetical protein